MAWKKRLFAFVLNSEAWVEIVQVEKVKRHSKIAQVTMYLDESKKMMTLKSRTHIVLC